MRLRLGSDLQGSGRGKVNTAVTILIAVGALVVGGILVTMGVAVEVIIFVTVNILVYSTWCVLAAGRTLSKPFPKNLGQSQGQY